MMTMIAGIAQAETPLHLAFMSNDGSVITIEARSLDMTVSGEKLIATNGTTSLELELQELVKMYFTNSSASVELISFGLNDGMISVYSLDGTFRGNFGSSAQAMSSLPKGIYLFETTDNKTIKIAVQ